MPLPQTIWRIPVVRQPFLLVELVIKRALASILWVAWRAHLNPFAFVRGAPNTAGRRYLDDFLAQHADECAGVFLEFGDPRYRSLFPRERVQRYDVLDVAPGPEVTIVGDIQHTAVPDNTYDVIVCTQVLEHVANPFLAAAELYRILKPGGRLLLTVPSAYPYHSAPGDYWRFTRDSLELLFAERFEKVQITPYGNRLTVVAAYWYWTQDHLSRLQMDQPDPYNPLLMAMYARK